MRSCLLVLLILIVAVQLAAGNDTPKRIIAIQRAGVSPAIDGVLNDSIWSKGTWENGFVQFIPNEGGAPSQQTDFKIFFDDTYLFVAIRCFDKEPDKIAHILSRRDNLEGDRVGIEIDSYHDNITSYCFYVSAAGVKWDYTSSDLNGNDENWNPIWWVKTSHDSYGWYAEMRIPLSELRFKPAANSLWGIQVGRRIYRNQEVDLWQPMKRDQQGWNANLGTLTWGEKLSSKLPFSITPYAVAQVDKFRKDADDPFLRSGHDSKFNAGFDAKIGLSNNWTTDITVNPDFGQVDADPSQVNLSAYEIFQEERRPFFIEGRNIFSFGVGVGDGDLGSESLFYTRRIGRRPHYDPDLADNEYFKHPEFTRIIGAAKISGRTPGGLSIGVMEAVTAREFGKIDNGTNRHSLEIEPLTNYAVVRVNQELNKGNIQLGAIATSTIRDLDADQLNYLHRNATTGGINYLQYFDHKRWSITFSSYFSDVKGSKEAILETQTGAGHYFQRPDAPHLSVDSSRTSLVGNGGRFILSKESGRFKLMLCTIWKSPQLEVNDLGFVRSVDDIMQIYWMGYRFYEPKGIMRSASLNFNQWASWTYGGEYKGIGGNVNGGLTFKNLWNFYMGVNVNLNQLSVDLLRGGPSVNVGDMANTWLSVETDNTKKFSANISYSTGGSTSNSSDKWMDMGLGFTYRPASFLNIAISPGFFREDNKLQYVAEATVDGSNKYILARIKQEVFRVSLRLNVSITPELTFQYWGQPFVATGDYSEFKRADDVGNASFSKRFRTYASDEISYNSSDEVYRVKENGVSAYTFDKPNFTAREFLSNMVIRWEYRPGCTLFAVWSQNRSSSSSYGKSRIEGDLGDLFRTYPFDVFLIKFSYRIGR